ncbi:hypothetical protein ACLOJK_020867 [Asimina triloba]
MSDGDLPAAEKSVFPSPENRDFEIIVNRHWHDGTLRDATPHSRGNGDKLRRGRESFNGGSYCLSASDLGRLPSRDEISHLVLVLRCLLSTSAGSEL